MLFNVLLALSGIVSAMTLYIVIAVLTVLFIESDLPDLEDIEI